MESCHLYHCGAGIFGQAQRVCVLIYVCYCKKFTKLMLLEMLESAVGMHPDLEGLGLDNAGLDYNEEKVRIVCIGYNLQV